MSPDPRNSSQAITTISARIRTGGDGTGDGASGGVDHYKADVYLGITGREYFLARSDVNDFQAGSDHTYVLGDGANVIHPDENDPRKPQRRFGDLRHEPVYLRFRASEETPEDRWHLAAVEVTVTGADGSTLGYSADIGADGIWLGQQAGQVVHLSLGRTETASSSQARTSDRDLKTAITPVAWH
ncbi:hypothetical protein HCN51_54675 [Nonomuraea sp. FMUSA5-5]|uniref:Uncharacterized protein n=1 Tax=Nonomuraea composti TaxID=2720023 RepID=A0ABX1BPI5_9ACTN|nr:hypothetical protein [Nonomuraea sp. FMUSA5-5]NJP98377.1 hypothetical protein [Nonomuraea sp. FMUSA5-5]